MKRDTWTNQFSEVVFALDFPAKSAVTPVDSQTERIPGESVHFPDPNLRAAIAEALGKAPSCHDYSGGDGNIRTPSRQTGRRLRDLRGLEFATNLETLEIRGNLVSDLSPIAGLTQLGRLGIQGNKVSDISPLRELKSLGSLGIYGNEISRHLATIRINKLTLVIYV